MNTTIPKRRIVLTLCLAALLVLISPSVAQAAPLCEAKGLQGKIMLDKVIKEIFTNLGGTPSEPIEAMENMTEDAAKLVSQTAMPCGTDNDGSETKGQYAASCRILTIRQLAGQALSVLRTQTGGDLPTFDRQVLIANQHCLKKARERLTTEVDADLQQKMALQFSMAAQLASKVEGETKRALKQISLASIEDEVTEILFGSIKNGQREENGLLFTQRLPPFAKAKKQLASQEDPCVEADDKVEHLCAPKKLTQKINDEEPGMQDAGVSGVTPRIARLAAVEELPPPQPLSKAEKCFIDSGAQFNGNNSGKWQSKLNAACKQLKQGGVVIENPVEVPQNWAFLDEFIKSYKDQTTGKKTANMAFLKGRHVQRQAAFNKAQQQVINTQQIYEKGICELQRLNEIEPQLWDLFDQETTQKANNFIGRFTPAQCRKIRESRHEQ